MEPLSIAGYLVFIIAVLVNGSLALKERNDYRNYLWRTT